MLILGIDTSCDDTSASVVEDGAKIISNIVSTQDEILKKYGGIVPELASRRHIENMRFWNKFRMTCDTFSDYSDSLLYVSKNNFMP